MKLVPRKSIIIMHSGYTLWLSPTDTAKWARRPGASWPGSTLSGKRLMVRVDSNGLCDLTVNGRDAHSIDGNELEACVKDHLASECRHLWPCWEPLPARTKKSIEELDPIP